MKRELQKKGELQNENCKMKIANWPEDQATPLRRLSSSTFLF
jgi:hypothetical protein